MWNPIQKFRIRPRKIGLETLSMLTCHTMLTSGHRHRPREEVPPSGGLAKQVQPISSRPAQAGGASKGNSCWSMCRSVAALKGQSNKIFDPLPVTNGLKYFRFWLRFRELFKLEFFGISPGYHRYPGKSISLGYHTAWSQSPRGMRPLGDWGPKSRRNVPLNRIRDSHMTWRGMKPKGDLLRAVWYRYPGEIDRLTRPLSCLEEIPKNWNNNEIWTKIKNISTHLSVAQSGSNDEKTEGLKSRWTVP